MESGSGVDFYIERRAPRRHYADIERDVNGACSCAAYHVAYIRLLSRFVTNAFRMAFALVLNKNVVFRVLDGAVVVFDRQRRDTIVLDALASQIVLTLGHTESQLTVDRIEEEAVKAFDSEETDLPSLVREHLAQLIETGLICKTQR